MYLVACNRAGYQEGIAFDDLSQAEDYAMSLEGESAVFLQSGELISYTKNILTGGKSFKVLVLVEDNVEDLNFGDDVFVMEELSNKSFSVLPLFINGTKRLNDSQFLIGRVKRCLEQ